MKLSQAQIPPTSHILQLTGKEAKQVIKGRKPTFLHTNIWHGNQTIRQCTLLLWWKLFDEIECSLCWKYFISMTICHCDESLQPLSNSSKWSIWWYKVYLSIKQNLLFWIIEYFSGMGGKKLTSKTSSVQLKQNISRRKK